MQDESCIRRFFVRYRTSSLARGLLVACLFADPAGFAGAAAEDLAVKAQRGREAMAAGRFDEAATLYGEITRALPDEPGMLLNLGMALSMAGRPKEAVEHLEAALRLRPDVLPASLFLGVARMDLGQPALAIAPLQKVVAAQPDNLEARSRLADAFWSLERFEPAAQQFRELTERQPRDPRAWYGLARSYEGLARGPFEELQRSAPESHYLLLLVAQQMEAEGKVANAFRLYREALEKRPGQPEAHEALARIYEQKDHADWAALEREKARKTPPDCRAASLECEFRAGRYAAVLKTAQPLTTTEGRYWLSRAASALAEAAFARLAALPPSPEATLRRVEVVLAQRRPPGEALEELKHAAAAWPDDLRIRRQQATVLYLAKDAEGAIAILEDLLKREPDSPELGLLLGEAWLKLLQPAKAVPVLEQVVGRDPGRLPAQAALGRAYLEDGATAKAIPPLLAALETDTDGSLHFQLARAYRATGQAERATEALARFQELRKASEAEGESLREEFRITPP